MQQFRKLFEPGKIGKLKIKNRIIMSPIGSPYSTPEGYTTDREIALWSARADGGVGLIYKSAWAFSPAFGPIFFPGHFDISDDRHAEDAQRFTGAIKAHGAKVACLLSHPGKAIASRRPDSNMIIAPSAIRDPLTGVIPRELSTNEISEFVEAFAEGAARGKKAGFEAVMFQGAHGYLIHQFLSPRTNQRKDKYGGNIFNRARFACEIIRRTRIKVGSDFPIVFRMNGDDYVEGGIRVDEAIKQAPLFVEAGADVLDVSAGPREAHHWQFITYSQIDGALIHLSAAIKKVVNVPVCTVGKISPQLAERALHEGFADFTDFARSLLADPEWPNKVKEGRLEDVKPCIYCNQCQTRDRRIFNEEPRQICAVNPALGRELEYKQEMRKVKSPKRVIVIGGGIAGMEAARTLALRGHKTSLYEKSDKLGGQWNIVTCYRSDQERLLKHLQRELINASVNVVLNQEITAKIVQELKPDALVIATGAVPAELNVPGKNTNNVVQAIDVLSGKAIVGQEAVIVGGRGVGLDTALFLAEQGKKVSVVEMHKIGWGLISTIRLSLWEMLIKSGVYTYPNTIVESIVEKGVNVISDGEMRFLKADTIILAVGYKNEHILFDRLNGLVSDIYTVGDCNEPRDVLAAINEASSVGRGI